MSIELSVAPCTAAKFLLLADVIVKHARINGGMTLIMNGAHVDGTDEDTLTALVCTMPERLREPIFAKYAEKYGEGLLEHIGSETSFSYKTVLVVQAMSPEHCRAKILSDAVVGLGTSEDQLIRVIAQTDLSERKALREYYEAMCQCDLVDHVRSETGGDFQKAFLCMLEAPSAKQMEEVNRCFVELYGKTLLERVEDETSGNFKATLQGCIRHPMVLLAHAVREYMAGWGTDDTGLVTLLVHLPDFRKVALIHKYSESFNPDLISDIKSDAFGSYEKALCSLVRPAPEIRAEALKGAMKGLGTSDELLIYFLVIAKDELSEVRKAFAAATG